MKFKGKLNIWRGYLDDLFLTLKSKTHANSQDFLELRGGSHNALQESRTETNKSSCVHWFSALHVGVALWYNVVRYMSRHTYTG